MPTWQRGLDHHFRTHLGVGSTDDLLAVGMSRATVTRWAADERLVRMLPGVFRSPQYEPGFEQWCAAICAAHPLAVVAFTSAALLWRFRSVRRNGIHVLTPHPLNLDIPDATVHRTRRIDAVDVVQRPDGIRLTSPPRTLFDSADMLGFDATRSILEQMLHEGFCTLDTVVDTYQRLAHPHRPGTRILGEVIASKPKWQRALQSDLERRVLDEIRRQGLPEPIAQCPVLLPTGQTIHLDFGWPEWRVGIEVDDPAWHAGAASSHRDGFRDRKASTVGWAVSRVSRIDIESGLSDAMRDVVIIIERRRGLLAG
jgi:very-short-patch-repair endonuclease